MSEKTARIFFIFGGSGDLTKRKLIPALYNLYLDKRMPDEFLIIGIGRSKYSNKAYREFLKEGVNKFSRRGDAEEESWDSFSKKINYEANDITKPEIYEILNEAIETNEKKWGIHPHIISYLAIAPFLIKPVAEHLGKSGMCKDQSCSRIVVEKPFGHDLQGAQELNEVLKGIFSEKQIYRIDHYLGKEAVQNILVLRFANILFEPIWNQNYIEHVQITVAEKVGVGTRAGYYDKSGALKDMIQNHLLQLLCFTSMEPPVSFTADSIRDRKADVLHAVRIYDAEEVFENTVRGQYGKGWVEGDEKIPYLEENGVPDDSITETYAAVKLYIDNWRWQGVPFYLRSGKHMPAKKSMITIQFRDVPHQIFPNKLAQQWKANRIHIEIHPDMGVRVMFQVKKIGLDMKLETSEMKFNYSEDEESQSPEAYETLLYDVMEGDATLFMRSDETEAAWQIIMPIVNAWSENKDVDVPSYDTGSWGPKKAEELLADDGYVWFD